MRDKKRFTKTILMLSPFSFAGLIWEPPLAEGMREIREGNFDRAVEVFEDAVGGELNQQEAVYGKALCYWFGIGVEKDQAMAAEVLEKDEMSPLKMEMSSEKQAAQYMLGLYYMKKRHTRALNYMKEAAQTGHALSQFFLGKYYYDFYNEGSGDTVVAEVYARRYLSLAVNNLKLSKKCKKEAEAMLNEVSEID